MLDIKAILDDPEATRAALARRGQSGAATQAIDELLQIAEQRREAVTRHSELRHQQKELSAAFGKGGPDPEARERLKAMSGEVKELDARVKALDEALEKALLYVPNVPHPSVPDGASADENVVVRTWGEPRTFDFEPLEHDVLGERLGLLDFEAARKISGARFALYRGHGARLERALAAFMLDLHTGRHGYDEILPPVLVTRQTMTGTGQLPKFEDEAFRTDPDDLFLIPTSEVPVTNVHREEILDGDRLPIRYCAYSPCFRREAGSYGRDTRGLTRLHQFQKVELVHFVRAEDSLDALEAMTGHAEAVLEALGLPYRRMALCAGDLGANSHKTYDLEVWLAGQKQWREISSCSTMGDFQARRAQIRYRPAPGDKPRFAHTLNGSGLAVGRTFMALIEYYQRADGGVDLPEVLWPYMGGVRSLDPK